MMPLFVVRFPLEMLEMQMELAAASQQMQLTCCPAGEHHGKRVGGA